MIRLDLDDMYDPAHASHLCRVGHARLAYVKRQPFVAMIPQGICLPSRATEQVVLDKMMMMMRMKQTQGGRCLDLLAFSSSILLNQMTATHLVLTD